MHAIHDGSTVSPDPIFDDYSVVLKSPKGLILICGCAHAGIPKDSFFFFSSFFFLFVFLILSS